VNNPLTGLMLAPAGAPASRLKVSVKAGLELDAIAVKLNSAPSLTDLFGIVARRGPS